MPEDTANAVGADSATLAHNMGVNSHEINGQPAWAKALSDAHARRAAERGDNWQHISSPVARVVANVLRKMEERDDG